jgi:hypothetical protein
MGVIDFDLHDVLVTTDEKSLTLQIHVNFSREIFGFRASDELTFMTWTKELQNQINQGVGRELKDLARRMV